jgi:DNA polymerase-1
MPPTAAAFDTETTGLHIIYDRPFLFQFGWYVEEYGQGWVYTVNLDQEIGLSTVRIWHALVASAPVYLGHNIKYDLHMMENIELPYLYDNIGDTQIYIRMAHDNIPVRKGGAPLGLKQYAAKYIDPQAKLHEKEIKLYQSDSAKQINKLLQRKLMLLGPLEENTKWTKGYMNKLFKNNTFNIQDLPVIYYNAYLSWYNALDPLIQRNMTTIMVESNDIPYSLVRRDIVKKYGAYDIIYTLEIHRKTKHVIDVRGNVLGLKLEQQCIRPLYRMERVGFRLDLDYLKGCEESVRHYIRDRREILFDLAGEPISCSQHKRIKELAVERFNNTLESTGSEEMTAMIHSLDACDFKEFLEIIQELRTLEKWYSTYIRKWLDVCDPINPRVYTQINQVGAASGRVTSDFQQFPKGKLVSIDGGELFNPRKMVLSEGKGLVYLDYSQIELRFQAIYTILLKQPDMNLCRAYMPYKCYCLDTMNNRWQFDFTKKEDIANWNKVDWYQNEDNEIWKPTDLHGAMTKEAFGIDETDPRWSKLRGLGKRMNFMKNYGGGIGQTRSILPDTYTEEEIIHIDGAYYRTFPGVRVYQDYCYSMAQQTAYVGNMFGIRYYGVSGHNLINMLVQGSAAYFLKKKIIEVDKYLTGHHSKFQMNIHDEMSFIWDERDSFDIFYEIKQIMEEWDDSPVPIVADMELTTTNWAEKEDI